MDPAGELAQLLQGLGQLAARAGDELLGLAGVAADPALDERELQGQGDQPLLGTVVEVALDAPSLGVGGGDDPLPGRLQLGEPGLGLGLQPPVLQGDRGRPADGLDQLGVVVERPVVHQRGDRGPSRSHHRRPTGPSPRLGQLDRRPSASTKCRPAGVGDRERRVVQHPGQRGLQLAGCIVRSPPNRSASPPRASRDRSSPARNATGTVTSEQAVIHESGGPRAARRQVHG